MGGDGTVHLSAGEPEHVAKFYHEAEKDPARLRIAHPVLAPSPWIIHGFFDDSTRLLFDRAFTSRLDRPSALEWYQHLLPYATKESGKVRVCAASPEHLHFSAGCPWCAGEDAARIRRCGERVVTAGGRTEGSASARI